MKIFKLQPYENKLDDENWLATKYYKSIEVRAANGDRARDISQIVCPTSGDRKSTGYIPTSPWLSSDLVECIELNESPYPVEGEEGVLDPPHLKFAWENKER